MKKFVSAFISLLFIALIMPPVAVANAAAEDFISYSYISAQDAYKVDACLKTASGELTIPSTYNDKPVVSIKAAAFDGCAALTKITVPSSITAIEGNAFYNCTGLEQVIINGNCTIGSGAFQGCSKLYYVKLPNNLTVIANNMFNFCTSLLSLEIPASVRKIGASAFSDCTSLENVTVPAAVTQIGENAFMNCTSLENIKVDSGNTVYTAYNGILFDIGKTTLIQYPAGKKDTVYNIPDGVVTIENSAFAQSNCLEKVVFSSSVKTVGDYAFDRCGALTAVSLSNVESLGSMSFARCSEIKTIMIPSTLASYDGAFYQSGLKYVKIEDGSSQISARAFRYCSSLEKIDIPDTVTKIGIGSFDGCTALEEVEIPSSVTSIGNGAFNGCGNVVLVVEEDSYALSYAEEKSINYRIKEKEVEKTVVSISIADMPSKTTYTLGEAIDTSGMTIKIVYNDASEEIVSSGFTVSPSNANAVGKQTVTVLYEGVGTTFTVNVNSPAEEKTVAGVTVQTLPAKTKYYYKDTLDTTGLTLKVTYSDGTTEIVDSGFTVDTQVLRKTGEQHVCVYYGENMTGFTVNVSFRWWQLIIYYLFLGFIWGY